MKWQIVTANSGDIPLIEYIEASKALVYYKYLSYKDYNWIFNNYDIAQPPSNPSEWIRRTSGRCRKSIQATLYTW